MPPQALFDYKPFDYDEPLYGIDEIRKFNTQRGEMEQLTAAVWVDEENHGIVGFKDVTNDEFWIEGHMPDFPLMPGVLMVEAAAQLASFYARKFGLLESGDYLGFGGLEKVRFRRPVNPPCRLIICVRATRLRPRIRAEFEFQGFVEDQLIFNGEMIGVPLSRDQMSS